MKNAVSKKTERILMRVLKYMEAEPDRVNMAVWGRFLDGETEDCGINIRPQPVPPCKTTACLAGSCLLVTKAGKDFLREDGFFSAKKQNKEYQFPWSSKQKAAEILGITESQSTNLFQFKDWVYNNFDNLGWPAKYEEQYKKAKTGKGRFQAVKRRVFHFIKTGE